VLSGGVGDLDSVRRSSIVASHPLDKGKLGVQSTAWYAVVAYDGNDHWQVFCAVRRLSSCASIERSPRSRIVIARCGSATQRDRDTQMLIVIRVHKH
jgi:hypothetical protein